MLEGHTDPYGMPIFKRVALEMVRVGRYWVGGMIFHLGQFSLCLP